MAIYIHAHRLLSNQTAYIISPLYRANVYYAYCYYDLLLLLLIL